MAASAAATSLHMSRRGVQCSPNQKPFFVGHPGTIPANLFLPRHPCSPSTVLTFARRRNTPPAASSKKQKKKQISHHKGAQEDEDLDEDAFEALFRQLEEDLKNDDPSLDDGDDEISEEDLAKLEKELEEALKDDELLGALDSIGDGKTEYESEKEEEEEEEVDDYHNSHDDHDLEDEDDNAESVVKLKNWQLKRLAYALKNGRRKTSIKHLAADLCLDRDIVLELLREPPPNLLLMSATLPDKPVSTIVEPIKEPAETISPEIPTTATTETKVKLPVHIMQSNWSAQKRLKKVQLETLESVYRRTKRPTNAMISSIVHVTNLPRKRVVKWFEDKRVEDGVPERRVPYQRPAPTHAC